MTPLVWFGPVSTAHVKGTAPPGFDLKVLGCLGDGPSPQCADHAAAFVDGSGERVPKLLSKFKLDSASRPVLAAFSAGGQILKRTALDADDRARIRGMYLADATYTIAWKEKGKVAGLDDITAGFVLLALDCIADGRPFCATAGASPNGQYPSAAQTLAAIWAEVEARSGRKLEDATGDPLLAGLRAPVRAGRLGNVLFADFGAAYKHAEHPTVIAPVLLPRMLALLDQPTPARDDAPAPTVAPVRTESTAPVVSWKDALLVGAVVAAVWWGWMTRGGRKSRT